MAVIHCEGRVVQSAAVLGYAMRLPSKVVRGPFWSISRMFSQWEGWAGDARLFAAMGRQEHGIQFKVFAPPAFVRQRIREARWASELEIAGTSDVLAMLGWQLKELWESSRREE